MFGDMENVFFLVGPLSFLVQIALCVHVYKTGRPYWWIWLLMMGSFIGCLLYVLVEIVPDARRSGSQLTTTSWFIPRRTVIKRARELLEDADTVQNRLNLAALLYGYGKKEEAERIATACVSGVFKDDADVISEVARYKVETGNYAEARQLVSQADVRNNKQAGRRIELLKARILFGSRKYDEALTGFTALQAASLGEEPRYYSALCHLELGHTQLAAQMLHDIMKYFRKGGKLWRRSQKNWYKAASLKVKEIQSDKPIRRQGV